MAIKIKVTGYSFVRFFSVDGLLYENLNYVPSSAELNLMCQCNQSMKSSGNEHTLKPLSESATEVCEIGQLKHSRH